MRDRDSGMDGMDRWVEMACVNWVNFVVVVVVANAPKKDLLMQRASRSVGRAFQKKKKKIEFTYFRLQICFCVFRGACEKQM